MLLSQTKSERFPGTTLDPLLWKSFASPEQDHITCPHFDTLLKRCLDTDEYAGSCAQLSSPLHATHEAGKRRMMRADHEHASSGSTPPQHFDFALPEQQTAAGPICFQTLPLPSMGLTFSPRAPSRPLKRGRAAADIDGEHSSTQKKKRRLRLFLITSRLSPQFSHPATNIVDRGSSKIAVWAKQKSLGRNLLRKAAILNRVRRRDVYAKQASEAHGRMLIEQEREQHELELARLEFEHGSIDTYTRPVTVKTPSVPPAAAVRTDGRFVVSGSPSVSPESSRSSSPTPSSPPIKEHIEKEELEFRSPNEAYASSPPWAQVPRRDYLPLPPSPLGLSNYDAFDVETEIPDPYSHLDDEEEEEEEAFTSSFHHDEEDESIPFLPSAVTSTSFSTLQSQASHMPMTLAQLLRADKPTLSHNEPVVGDYDLVGDNADAVWPSTFVPEPRHNNFGSTSPDFKALFATSTSKRIDSFVEPPETRPDFSQYRNSTILSSSSPNFDPITATASNSPNFIASTSPNFAPLTSPTLATHTASPNSPNLAPSCVSPNFAAADAPIPYDHTFVQRRHSLPAQPHPNFFARKESDTEEERQRQRHLMFMRFG